MQDLTDQAAAVGLNVPLRISTIPAPVDWVIIYSREPNSLEYRTTACIRLDGNTGCPTP